jgi:hypothetical protein
LGIPEQVQH